MKLCLAAAAVALLVGACIGSSTIARRQGFEEQGAVVSPHDEEGGRFDGARISPGFGVLYLHGYSDEGADQPACGGFLSETAEHVLEVAQAARFKLVVHSENLLAMGLRGPDGTLVCAVEPNALNANVSLTHNFQPGRYEVLIGNRHRQTTSGYRLVLSE